MKKSMFFLFLVIFFFSLNLKTFGETKEEEPLKMLEKAQNLILEYKTNKEHDVSLIYNAELSIKQAILLAEGKVLKYKELMEIGFTDRFQYYALEFKLAFENLIKVKRFACDNYLLIAEAYLQTNKLDLAKNTLRKITIDFTKDYFNSCVKQAEYMLEDNFKK